MIQSATMRAIAGGVVLLLVSIIIVVSIVLLTDNGNKTQQQQSSTEAQELGSSRIIGGREANANRYPYTVTLLNRINEHACGGTLIARDVVLTAAHCQGGTGTFIGGNIVVGRHNLNNDDEGTVYSNRNEIPHPSFNSDGIITNFDIMLVFLEGNMLVNNTWVKLNSNVSVPVVNQSVTVMGWGKTDINDVFNAGSDVLMNVEVNIVPNDECQQSEAYGQSYSNLVTENVLCARDVGQDSCQGDSGGPLIVRGNDVSTDVQIGIVSYGIGCAMEQFPGIYARISKAYNWIETEVCKGSLYASEAGFNCSGSTTYKEKEEDAAPSYAPLTVSPSVFIEGSYSPTPPFTWYTPVIDGTNSPTTTQIIDPLFTLPIQDQETKPPSNSPSMLPSMIREATLTPTITLPIESTTEPTVQSAVVMNVPTDKPTIETSKPTVQAMISNEPTVEPIATLTPTLNATADQQQSKFKCKWISRVGGISNPNNELCTKDDEGFPTPYLCDGIDGFVTVCCTFSSKVNTFMAGKFGTCYKVESR
jgi:trypsin